MLALAAVRRRQFVVGKVMYRARKEGWNKLVRGAGFELDALHELYMLLWYDVPAEAQAVFGRMKTLEEQVEMSIREGDQVGRTIFIDGLDRETPKDKISTMFGGPGDTLEVEVVGRHAALVTYKDCETALKAIAMYNGADIGGGWKVSVRMENEQTQCLSDPEEEQWTMMIC